MISILFEKDNINKEDFRDYVKYKEDLVLNNTGSSRDSWYFYKGLDIDQFGARIKQLNVLKEKLLSKGIEGRIIGDSFYSVMPDHFKIFIDWIFKSGFRDLNEKREMTDRSSIFMSKKIELDVKEQYIEGISASGIARFEKDARNVSIDNLANFLEGLGYNIKMDYLEKENQEPIKQKNVRYRSPLYNIPPFSLMGWGYRE